MRAGSTSTTHRNALDAALRKAAILERLDAGGDPYGAAGQALGDFVKREKQLVANGEDVMGWICTVTDRRWINELRYQRRRGYARFDAAFAPGAGGTLLETAAARGPRVDELVEIREQLRDIAGEQCAALAHLRATRVRERHVRVVELALAGDLVHEEIARTVNGEFAGEGLKGIAPNTVTQIVGRQRERLAATGAFPTVVARLRRTRRAA
jgi:hypothetical protein